MIVAGIGCRKNASVDDVLAAINAALKAHALSPTALSALATAKFKQDEAAIIAAGQRLQLPVLLADEAAMQVVSLRALTQSQFSLAVSGAPSVSETAALAGAGRLSRLLGPRTVHGPVTCAIAESNA
ncbi:cobalamin biosynthesis protein [Mesorhizobium sp. SP-1A]|uniref:cobalamin biosynthesis protein n=1 Tax=Mesorhizobium sp. SP-1A TaxID=3077840 RepID=UPI0028F7297F|nr:cobalamin biosynthesis protein [Mesorhizobium sp. SP-1A]